ncbi:ATP-dependent DNA helicase, partial [Pseudoloma neurophilia]
LTVSKRNENHLTVSKRNENHLTVVISPLLSLIHDQMLSLLSKGICALAYHGNMSYKEKQMTKNIILNGMNIRGNKKYIKILFTTPESLIGQLSNILNDLKHTLVIDEAHCISSWGGDFRPDYQKIRSEYVNVVALTGSADQRVENDIFSVLFESGHSNMNFHSKYDLKYS